jgi:hypothetical protein
MNYTTSGKVQYEDTVSYFKIHLAERYTWVMCRLYLGHKRPSVWMPLPLEHVQSLAPGLMLNTPQAGWTCITLTASGEIERLGDVLCAAWDSQKAVHSRKPEDAEPECSGAEPNWSSNEVAPGTLSGELNSSERPSEALEG